LPQTSSPTEVHAEPAQLQVPRLDKQAS